MIKKMLGLLLWVFTFQLVGFLIGRMTQLNIVTWYQTLNKSTFNPPEIVFPIVWSILYIMIAVAGWYLWQKRNEPRAKLALVFYAIQVVMNWLWTPIFFQLHMIQLGFYWIIGIITFNFITILISGKHYKLTTIMLVPYLFWLMFAGYLNWSIWMNN
ncbi:MAG: tryptophan-rich sensory protein [Gammaproteobacteria bacterium]|nr:tryptophan-rich sensory protein [Gammaproteobacteria bacterium]